MSNQHFQRQGEQPSRIKIQVQCINCRALQWIRGPEELKSAAITVRWDCPYCHFNNQTNLQRRA